MYFPLFKPQHMSDDTLVFAGFLVYLERTKNYVSAIISICFMASPIELSRTVSNTLLMVNKMLIRSATSQYYTARGGGGGGGSIERTKQSIKQLHPCINFDKNYTK